MKSIFVSGASGFVGRTLTDVLAQSGHLVIAGVRHPETFKQVRAGVKVRQFSLETPEQSAESFNGVDTIVHLAAQVHVLDASPQISRSYATLNAAAPCRVAELAAQIGVRRMIFVSSAKVNGEESCGMPFTAGDAPNPKDAYGRSKLGAELELLAIAKRTGIEIAIVRPPLVYGPGVRANFLRLMDLVASAVPLPFASIHNRRSLVSVWNLCDLLRCLIVSGNVAGKTWMVSDDEDISTPELIRRLGIALGRPARLVPCPAPLLRALGTFLGRREEIDRLCGSFQVDIADTKATLGWSPPVTLNVGLGRTVNWYLASRET